MSILLSERWISLFPGHANGARRQALAELDRRYREAHRHYHTWEHIESCLKLFDRFHSLSRHPLPVELAIWYHDAVYHPGDPDNESQSARLFSHHAETLGLAPSLRSEVEGLILSTRHEASSTPTGTGPEGSVGRSLSAPETPGSKSQNLLDQPGGASRNSSRPGNSVPSATERADPRDVQLLSDIDLAILGAPRETYNAYVEAIRAEFSAMDPAQFARGRRLFLEGMLAKRRIFSLREIGALYEDSARNNLAAEIDSITKSGRADSAL